jgi:hypothetical protein
MPSEPPIDDVYRPRGAEWGRPGFYAFGEPVRRSRHARFPLPLHVLILCSGLGCSSASSPGAAPPPCTVGADQTCNDDPAISSLWGRCTERRVCECKEGLELNPATGRCRPAP